MKEVIHCLNLKSRVQWKQDSFNKVMIRNQVKKYVSE